MSRKTDLNSLTFFNFKTKKEVNNLSSMCEKLIGTITSSRSLNP